MIKLTSLHVIGYKNFTDTEIDFIESEKYCAFIGLNASGKSNLLEVISKIFAELYTNKGLVFEYKYVLNQVDSGNGYHDFNIEQSWFYNKKYRLGLSLNRKDKHHESLNTFGVSFNYYF